MNTELMGESEEIAVLYGFGHQSVATAKASMKGILKQSPEVKMFVGTSTQKQHDAKKYLPALGFKPSSFIQKSQHQDTQLAFWTASREEVEKAVKNV